MWGLQQPTDDAPYVSYVVITPQSGVFNNDQPMDKARNRVVITPQNGVFNNNKMTIMQSILL